MKFVMIGAGQSAQLVAEILKRLPEHECVGFLDRDPAMHGRTFHGLRVLGSSDDIASYAGKVEGALPVLGDIRIRRQMFEKCRSLGFKIPNVIDPSINASSDVKWGEGIIASLGVNIITSVEIQDYVFIGTGVNILHDTTIGSNCIIGGGTTVGAAVTVGRDVSFGVGVTVASGRKSIGNNVKIAAGAVVLNSVPDNAFVLGNPARVIGVVE